MTEVTTEVMMEVSFFTSPCMVVDMNLLHTKSSWVPEHQWVVQPFSLDALQSEVYRKDQ